MIIGKKAHIFVNGSCKVGSRGQSAAAWTAIVDDGNDSVGNVASVIGTSNQAELTALLNAFTNLDNALSVVVYSSSEYLVNAFTNGIIENWKQLDWKKSDGKPVANILLMQKIYGEVLRFHDYKFVHRPSQEQHPFLAECKSRARIQLGLEMELAC